MYWIIHEIDFGRPYITRITNASSEQFKCPLPPTRLSEDSTFSAISTIIFAIGCPVKLCIWWVRKRHISHIMHNHSYSYIFKHFIPTGFTQIFIFSQWCISWPSFMCRYNQLQFCFDNRSQWLLPISPSWTKISPPYRSPNIRKFKIQNPLFQPCKCCCRCRQ